MIPLYAPLLNAFTFTSHSRGFEIRQNNKIIATLRKPSIWSSRFVAATPHASWTIRGAGLLGFGAEILETASQQTVATFKSSWSGKGTLMFADGQRFVIAPKGFWRPLWIVVTESGQQVLHLDPYRKRVEVANASATLQDRVSLLILFTLYRLRQTEDAASAGAVAAVAAGT